MISDDTALKERIWAKATAIEGYNPAVIRQDPCGAWIKYDMYGMRDHAYGWEIDHIVPLQTLRQLGVEERLWDDELNLRPINCSNNTAKGSDFPIYTAQLTAEGELNVEGAGEFRVNAKLLQQLCTLYNGLEI